MKRNDDQKEGEVVEAEKVETAKPSEGEAQSESSEESKSEEKSEDAKAEDSNENKSEERRGDSIMKRTQEKKPSSDDVRKETLAHVSEVMTLCRKHSMGEDFQSSMIKEGKSVEEVRSAILDKLASASETNKVRGNNVSVTQGDYDQKDVTRAGVENAILHRFKPTKHELTEQGKMFRGMTLLDMARHCLEAVNIRTLGTSRNEMLERAFATRASGYHTTSDFPLILEDIVNKTLRAGYREAPQTFMPFTRMVTVSDFKTISRTQIGDSPELLEIPESGEYKDGTIPEGAEKYVVKDYGRMVSLTRKTILNDDLDAFTRVPEMYGRRARSLESNLAWLQITSNPNMADGNAVFSAAHNNLTTGPGTAITVDAIGVMRARMRRQLSLGGDFINVDPRYLVVPAALETKAAQFIAQIQPDQAGNVNPFAQNLRQVTEPRLDDDSALSWYAFSTADEIDILEMAHLSGEEEPMIASKEGWRVDGVELKVRHTVGVKIIDFRGVQKNVGA